jgi:guanylate kinase
LLIDVAASYTVRHPTAHGSRVLAVARVFVITGPSGVGKGTLIRGLMERLGELQLSVSATTRAPRPGERDSIDYHFLDREEFERRVAAGEFVEHADYAGRSYGTLRSELEGRVRAGAPVVLEIEVQGARQVRRSVPDAVQVFIAPPSLQALRTRLIGRGTDDLEEVERRLRVAAEELEAQPEFAHVVVNDRLQDALEQLTAIVADELEGRGTTLEAQPGKATTK